MDIGPIRSRFTVEPVVSPVGGEPAPVHEPAATERVAPVPSAPAEHGTASPTRA